jgi:glycine cleavage system H protein
VSDFLEARADKFIFRVRKGLLYHPEECWLRIEGDEGTIGVSDYLQQSAGDVSFIELPEPGAQVRFGEKLGVLETIKAVVDLVSPATGTVIETNPFLADEPDKVNADPYADGWLIRIRLDPGGAPADLMSEEEYFSFMQEKIGKQL